MADPTRALVRLGDDDSFPPWSDRQERFCSALDRLCDVLEIRLTYRTRFRLADCFGGYEPAEAAAEVLAELTEAGVDLTGNADVVFIEGMKPKTGRRA